MPNNQMITLPKNVDLTNGKQKLLAATFIAMACVGVYMLLPPMIAFVKNVWLFLYYGVPLAILIWNYEVIWHNFKRMSWALTKWSISKDKPSYLYKFHDWVLGKIQSQKDNLQKIKGVKNTTFEKIKITKGEIDAETRRAEGAIRQNQDMIAKGAYKKKTIKEGFLNKLLPRYELLDKMDKQLSSVLEIRIQDAEDLKYFIDSKVEEYETFKEIDAAVKEAGMEQEDNADYKNYLESLKQIEKEMGLYAANIEMFDTQIKPLLAKVSVDKAIADEDAIKFIEEYKANRFVPAFKELANSDSITPQPNTNTSK